jgi:sulfopyruvate decarboxylase alpha subunit
MISRPDPVSAPRDRTPDVPPWADGVCRGVYAAGCRDVVYVPDNPLSHVLRVFETRYADVRLVLATREEEAFGIAAGLYLGGRKPTVLLQSSGLGNSLNAITSLLVPYQIPVLMIVSMRGDAGEWNSAQMPMGRAVRDILDAIGIAHATVGEDGAADTVRRAGESAFASCVSHACLLPKRLTGAASPLRPRSVPAPSLLPPSAVSPLSTATPTSARSSTPTSMTRIEATQIVVRHAGEGVIVASLGHPAYDLFAAGDRPRNFYTWGSMGLASSIGLGLALARPDVRIFVLDGDGSLLMNLGSLATIGLLQPRNLVLIVMDNELFATTGGQQTPTAFGADIAAAARAMRIDRAVTARTPRELADAVTRAATEPVVVVAKVQESAPTAKPPNDCVQLKERFMAALEA